MEEKRWYLIWPIREGQELEEGAATLLDLARVEVKPLMVADAPCCGPDLLSLSAECRRRGAELVIKRDGKFKFKALLEVRAELMNKFRESAKLQPASSMVLFSEVLRFIKYRREERVLVQFVKTTQVRELLIADRKHTIPMIGLPLAQFPGVPGLHFPGCAHQS
jgi:hypothetical protein